MLAKGRGPVFWMLAGCGGCLVVVILLVAGLGGSLFYMTRGPVDAVIPVDIYIPGCPPNPYALLHGILLAMGKLDHHAAAGAPRPHFRSIAFGIHM